jgi:hypothetical protein
MDTKKLENKQQPVEEHIAGFDGGLSYEELSLEEQRIQLEKELLELEREKLDDMQRNRELEEFGEVDISVKHLVMVAVVCLLFSGVISYLCGFDVGKKYAPPPKYVELDKSFIEAVTPSALPNESEKFKWTLKAAQADTLLIHIR